MRLVDRQGQTYAQRLTVSLVLLVAVAAGTPLRAQTWDLAADWSDAANPFGPGSAWTIWKAPGTAFPTNQPDWWSDGTNQRAWADQPFNLTAHVPVWMKVTNTARLGTGFANVGSVILHTAESGRTGTDLSSVIWTSPSAGAVSLDGGVWLYQGFDRPQFWELFLNGASLTGGALTVGDGFTEASPFASTAGSGGAGAAAFAVHAGDVIELRLRRQPVSAFGSFIGVDLAITLVPTVSPVPEPMTLGLLATGLVGIAGLAWRRRSSR